MNTYAQQKLSHQSRVAANALPSRVAAGPSVLQLVDDHLQAAAQRRIAKSLNHSSKVASHLQLQQSLNQSPRVVAQSKLAQTLSKRKSLQQPLQAIQRQEASEERELGILPEEANLEKAANLEEEQPQQSEPIQKQVLPEAGGLRQREVGPVQSQQNKTGLPHQLKTNLESRSGMQMDDVKVEYNSSRPAQMKALAFTQGNNIQVAPGQEKHLAHEAWHVVQQRQGRVKPTVQMKGVAINDDPALEHEADEMGKQLETGSIKQHTAQSDPSVTRSGSVLQAKWIVDKRFQYLIWDRQLDGLRWYCFPQENTYFFFIEESDLIPALLKFEGPTHARTMSEWVREGFVEGTWKPTDGEIVPFEADQAESIKLANSDIEISRSDLEKQAIGFLKSGETGNEAEMFQEFDRYLQVLRDLVIPAIAQARKELPPSTVIEKISRIWSVLNEETAKPNKAERIEKTKNNWETAMTELEQIMNQRILQMLMAIKGEFGETAYVESLNASLNLLKRFLSPSSKAKDAHPLLKAFEVFHQLEERFAQLTFRRQEPIKAMYKEPEIDPRKLQSLTLIQLGTQMKKVEVAFDVLARRTGANKDSSIKHIHEVDLAFVRVFSGVTEAYANPRTEGGLSFQGGGGVGEKVFAVGHKGAVDFRADVVKKEERLYALIFPKGFVDLFGLDLKKLGGTGASAREPNEKEFSRHLIPKRDKDPDIAIPINKMFFIRAEKSTPDLGQVDIHFGWRDMQVNASEINYVDFFRHYVLAVVEFTKNGTVIKIQLLKEPQ